MGKSCLPESNWQLCLVTYSVHSPRAQVSYFSLAFVLFLPGRIMGHCVWLRNGRRVYAESCYQLQRRHPAAAVLPVGFSSSQGGVRRRLRQGASASARWLVLSRRGGVQSPVRVRLIKRLTIRWYRGDEEGDASSPLGYMIGLYIVVLVLLGPSI